MSAGTPPKAGKALIDRLPPDRRNELIMIGREALGRFGYAFQEVFDGHLALFDYLAARGATAVMVGRMLAEVGIAREDGTPLPAGTVSSALSRARERAVPHPDAPLHAPARPGMHMQVPAKAGNALQHPGDQRSEVRSPAALPGRSASPPPAASPHFPEIRLSPNSPAATQVPAVTRRSAALLEKLRSKQDDD
ncbi:hypothetical protein [Bradyrhizobium sp. Ash2021]|uniref:hypothetical protein n=1 Tax=Bradyrhizobium sp. Ash2021 TaxID=2954771 RepID=UPI0028161C4D|nr:hypothetical protein [Bradyrhizobium sp. Ash2021]WMT76534.1 hypothetical protein NL528_09300 [Bradyrhizobium sp. Ash2021]